METLTASPSMLKQVNLSMIRKAIKGKGAATRAEIALETKISPTTVRLLLTEMQRRREIESIGYDESSGGRKAERYRFRSDRYYGAAFCLTGDAVHFIIVNICGELVETGVLALIEGDIKQTVAAFLDELRGGREIKAIGFGVSGVVDMGGYTRNCPGGEPFAEELGNYFTKRYGVPVVLENDIYAVALGFALCYQRKFPGENPGNMNMAFLYFAKNCVSAGFIAGGKVIRGFSNYAGELGLIPGDGAKTMDEFMDEPVDDLEFAKRVANMICWICGVLNPKYVAIGGPAYRKKCHGFVGDAIYGLLPGKMLPELFFSPDILLDYYEGMAYLTAAKIFDEVQLVKGRT